MPSWERGHFPHCNDRQALESDLAPCKYPTRRETSFLEMPVVEMQPCSYLNVFAFLKIVSISIIPFSLDDESLR